MNLLYLGSQGFSNHLRHSLLILTSPQKGEIMSIVRDLLHFKETGETSKKEKMRFFWSGSTPENCDLCKQEITTSFVDGKTVHGPWGILCSYCHRLYGVGLGTGKGRKYAKVVKDKTVRWERIGG